MHEGRQGPQRAQQACARPVRQREDGEGEIRKGKEVIEVELIEVGQGEVVAVHIGKEEGHDVEEVHLLQVEDFADGQSPLVL